MIRTLELLAKSALFAPRGCFSWELIRELSTFERPHWFVTLLGESFRYILYLRLTASCGLLLFFLPSVQIPCLIIAALTSLLLNLRMPVGQDGSDQMSLLILIPASLAFLFHQELAKVAVLVFVAAQASLAYTTSGIAKLISPVWRSGKAIPQILSTLSYGHGLAARAFSFSPTLCLAVCWSIIMFETLFCLWPLTGTRGLVGILAVGAAFHLSCAALMGLNCFLWSFLATYPAIIFTSAYLRQVVHFSR
jgi:hypothetical protein